MFVYENQVVVVQFTTAEDDGTPVDADSTPTGTLYGGGGDLATPVVTVTTTGNTGVYYASFTYTAAASGLAIGDFLDLHVAATIATNARAGIVWRAQVGGLDLRTTSVVASSVTDPVTVGGYSGGQSPSEQISDFTTNGTTPPWYASPGSAPSASDNATAVWAFTGRTVDSVSGAVNSVNGAVSVSGGTVDSCTSTGSVSSAVSVSGGSIDTCTTVGAVTDPVTVGGYSSGQSPTDLTPTAAANATAVWANGTRQLTANGLDLILVETTGSLTVKQALGLVAAVCAGTASGAGTTSIVFKGVGTSTTRVTATVDGSGNRSAVAVVPI